MGFPRSGDPAVFANSAAVVQAAFDEEIARQRQNSELVELADDHVLVLRVTAHHLPTVRPLDEVRDQITRRADARARARSSPKQAAQRVPRGVEQGGDPARARSRRRTNGTWIAPAWVERTDASVPTEYCRRGVRLAEARGGCGTARENRRARRTAATRCSCSSSVEAGPAGRRDAGRARSAAAPARGSIGARGAHELRRQRARRGHRPDSRRHSESRRSSERAPDAAAVRDAAPVAARVARSGLAVCASGCWAGKRHADDVEAGVDVDHLARDAGGEVGAQERRALPTSSIVTLRFSGEVAPTCAIISRMPLTPEAASVRIGPAEIALIRMPLAPRSTARNRTFASRLAFARPITL